MLALASGFAAMLAPAAALAGSSSDHNRILFEMDQVRRGDYSQELDNLGRIVPRSDRRTRAIVRDPAFTILAPYSAFKPWTPQRHRR
jgi:hypothetical protein